LLPRIKLVLFSAPAGFGKTTAMLQWIEPVKATGMGIGWVTLDAQDNDIGRFLGYLVAALNRCAGEAQEDSDRGSLFDSQTAPLGSLLDVIDHLSSVGTSFALFLDDYESITNPAIHEIVRQVIDNLPTGSHLVIGTRTQPPLGLGKLRAREQLVEVGIDRLRFSLADATHYFNQVRHLSISERDVAELHRCTEGWATAIQLASLSIVGQTNVEKFVRSFGGDQSAIADYLAEDVFSHQEPLVQDFLLKTSILDSLNPDICNALTGRNDAGALLERIEKANLFLVALDGVRKSYRYHNLFADFLRGRLARLHPEQIAELNSRAASWYEAEGTLTTALEHALAAGNLPLATTLLEQVAEVLLYEGRVATLIRYVESMPKETIAGLAGVRLAYAWALIFAHRYQEVKLVLASLSQNNGNLDERSRDEILTLGPCVLLWSDRIDECIVIAAENLPKLSGGGDFACGALINIYAMCLTTESRFSEAQEMLSTAKRHMARANSDYGLVYADCIEGIIHFSQGRLRTALAQFETVFRYASQRSRYSSASAVAAIYLAEAWYEENNVDAAEELLSEYLLLIRQTGLPDHIIAAHRILSRIAFARGTVDEAQFHLSEMEHLGLARGSGRVVSSARLEKTRIALIHGDLELAASLLKREEAEEGWRKTISGTPHANELDDIRLYNIRLRLKAGAAGEAMALLRQEFENAPQAAHTRRHLLAKLLMALAQHLAGNTSAAQKNAIEVLEFAADEGHRRLILDEHYLVGPLLSDLLGQVRRHSTKAAQLLEQLTGQSADDAVQSAEAAVPPVAGQDVDALTHREMQILTLVAAGHSNREMANKLFLSEATIKTHMRNISSKLGVHSRTQAIALARSRRLI
jgi:LuxR family maltose regulon positive regulatory protein